MVKQFTGIFLCALTLLACQVQAASSFSICLMPDMKCCSQDAGDCCDSAPGDCCIEMPGEDLLFFVPQEERSLELSGGVDLEKPVVLWTLSHLGEAYPAEFSGPDPPLPSGRGLLTLVQSFLI